MEIDVIIPLYKPGKELFTLLDKLDSQSVPVHEVILLNTGEKYFEQLIYGTRFLEKYQNIKVYHVSKREFDHGGTRRMGVKKSSADIFVMMTQDAMPADDNLIEQLTEPLRDQVAVSYARQLPREDCAPVACYTREFNYPAQSRIKSAEDLKTLGIKTFFCSNVCAAYRRDVTAYLRKNHMSGKLLHFYIQCACKYAGYLLGKNYRRLPGKWVLAFTSNKEYWKQNRKDV